MTQTQTHVDVVTVLQKERAELADALAKVEALLATYAHAGDVIAAMPPDRTITLVAPAAPTRRSAPVAPTTPLDGRYRASSIRAQLEAVLESRKRPMDTQELREATGSAYRAVYGTLVRRKGIFTRKASGQWALTRWGATSGA